MAGRRAKSGYTLGVEAGVMIRRVVANDPEVRRHLARTCQCDHDDAFMHRLILESTLYYLTHGTPEWWSR